MTNEIWTHFSVYFLNLYESAKPTENSFSDSLIGSSYRVTFHCYFYPLKWPPSADVPETGITWSVQLTSALSDSPIVCQSNIKRPNQIIFYRIMIHQLYYTFIKLAIIGRFIIRRARLGKFYICWVWSSIYVYKYIINLLVFRNFCILKGVKKVIKPIYKPIYSQARVND